MIFSVFFNPQNVFCKGHNMNHFNHQRGRYLRINKAEIYIETLGDCTKPKMIMLHGGLGHIQQFNGIVPSLLKNFYLVGIDSHGHGKSTFRAERLSYEFLQLEIEKVLKTLGIRDNMSILGFSNGGTIAYRLAAFSKLKIDRVITIGAPWHNKHLKHIMPAYEGLTVTDWRKQCPKDYQDYVTLNPEPNLENLFHHLKMLALDTSSKSRPNSYVKNIHIPIRALRGENDPIVREEHLKELRERAPNVKTLTIPKRGHEVCGSLENWEDFLLS